MGVLELARLQFASTTIFHYFFVPVSIGLALIIAILQTLYVVKDDEVYKRATKFWGRLFLINFAVGVVTGILQEFQFGMNWSTYSRFVGDVFGPSLAIEGLLAFFLESTFIGIWVFGWDRLSKRVHLLSIWLVSLGTILSAFWILSANAFMQNPVGYEFADGRAQMTSFVEILTNKHLWVQFPHVLFSAFVTGAMLVAGVSAWKIYRKHNVEVFNRSLRISVVVATISVLFTLGFGHQQVQLLYETQPMKLAAAEAQWENSPDPAPFTVVANIDYENRTNTSEIQIPYMLSLLTFNKFSGSIQGINEIQEMYVEKYGPGNYIPPVKTVFWSLRIMVLSGMLILALGLYGWYASRKDLVADRPFFAKLMLVGISLPFIGNTFGWIMTEIGRQPWVVFGVMQTEDAVSPNVTFYEVLFSFIAFTTLYAILAGISVFLFVRHIKKGVVVEEVETSPEDPFDEEGTVIVS